MSAQKLSDFFKENRRSVEDARADMVELISVMIEVKPGGLNTRREISFVKIMETIKELMGDN